MKLLLVKVLALTLVTTTKDALVQAQNHNKNVAALRGSVFVQGDIFLTRDDDDDDDDSTCQEAGEVCERAYCCSGLECEPRRVGDDICCKRRGSTCSSDSECCGPGAGRGGYCYRGECYDRPLPDMGDDRLPTNLDVIDDQSMKALFLTEDEDSTCREIGETCGPNHPACCDWINYCSSWHRTCCLGPGQTCSDDSECCTTSDWSGLCINGQCII